MMFSSSGVKGQTESCTGQLLKITKIYSSQTLANTHTMVHITSQKTWILNKTALETSNLANLH